MELGCHHDNNGISSSAKSTARLKLAASAGSTTTTTIGIVGAGAAGIIMLDSLVCEIVDQYAAPSFEILLFERSDSSFARGEAYGTPYPSHILNMKSDTMSAVYGQEEHFKRWLIENGYTSSSSSSSISTTYPPRSVYGDYLNDIHNNTLRIAARHGLRVQIVRDEVVDVGEAGHSLDLTLRHGKPQRVDTLILACGNWPAHTALHLWGKENYHHSPWPAGEVLPKVPHDSDVLVIGSGLSAVDVTVALIENGHSGHIQWASRSGRIPKVQGVASSPDSDLIARVRVRLTDLARSGQASLGSVWDVLTSELDANNLTAVDVFSILKKRGNTLQDLEADVADARKGGIAWQTGLLATKPVVEELWRALPERDRRVFRQSFAPVWGYYRHAMALQNAEKILAYMRSGQLTVNACPSEIAEANGRFLAFLDDRLYEADVVVNASGQGTNMKRLSEAKLLPELIERMYQNGLVGDHPIGTLAVDADLRPFKKDGSVLESVYALGHLTRGHVFYVNGIDAITEQAHSVAQNIVADRVRAGGTQWSPQESA